MELKGIKEFLERYKKTLLRSDLIREEITQIINNISGVSLKNNEYKIERGEIVLLTSPIKKNQIFLYKKKIIETLNNGSLQKISEIR